MSNQTTPMKFDPCSGKALDDRHWKEVDAYRDAVAVWQYDPWVGTPRTSLDVASDPQGKLIVPPGEEPPTEKGTPWAGGECPVPGDTVVEVLKRDAPHETNKARAFDWRNIREDLDEHITAFRIVTSERSPEPSDNEYILVSDTNSEVLKSGGEYNEIKKLAGLIRRAGGSATIFKAIGG